MAILTDSRCLLCHFRKNIDTARGLGSEAQATIFARELMKIYLDSPADVGATWFGPATAELFDRIYGVGPDRFLEEKRQSNDFVLARMEQIRSRIKRAEDPVLAGLKFAILGNYIDFSALYGEVSFEKLEEMLLSALEMELDMDVYRSLCRELERGGKLLYLTDNAGEIGFDRLFAEAIAEKYPGVEITFCVRGGPALNDATRDDAAQVGIPFPVIDNGNLVPGTELKILGAVAREALEQADIIIAKGQANAETLLDSGYNIYFAFLIKCVRFMERYDLPKLTPMLVKERK